MDNIKKLFVALLKAKRIDISDEFTFTLYWDMVKGIPQDKLLTAIKKAIATKYQFFEIADLIELSNGGSEDKLSSEGAWKEVLESAKRSGRVAISARSAKALNSLGGMSWLREANRSDVNWQKKEFLEAYANTPEPHDNDFRCEGLEAPTYILPENQKLLNTNNAITHSTHNSQQR